MAEFKFDKRALEMVANEAVRKRAFEMQRALDAVHRSHQGKAVGEVKAALRSACRRAEMTPDAQQLQQWSELISRGTRIVFEVKPTRL